MDEKKMRVELVRIQNVLGVESAEFRPGAVTVISGKSDTGKTSVLNAIKAAVKGGRDATLLRHGETDGCVVLVLEGGTTVTKRFTEDGASLAVRAQGVGRLSAGQSFLDELIQSDSFNPVEFLEASAKRRVEMLLRGLPAEAKAEVVAKLGGQPKDDVLDLIQVAYKRLYDERTGLNRMANENAVTAGRILESLPPASELDFDWGAKLKESDAELDKLDQEAISAERISMEARELELTKASEEYRVELEKVQEESNSLMSAAEARVELENQKRRELEDAIRKIQEDVAACDREIALAKNGVKLEQEERRKVEAQLMVGLRQKEEAAKKKHIENQRMISDENKSKRKLWLSSQETTRAKAEAAALGRKQRETARDFERKAAEAAEKADALTKRLEDVQLLKEKLLAKLPISGLKIVDGAVEVDGVPFDRLSDSRKIEFVVEVAAMCPGRLGLICVDGLEKLDSERFGHFCAEVAKRGVQVIGTRVDDGALRVESEGQTVGVVKGGATS